MTVYHTPNLAVQTSEYVRTPIDRLLPSSIDAERAVLGSVLLNRDAIIAVATWLQPDDFYTEQHAWVYEAMLDCYGKRIPPDTRMVSDTLRRFDRLDAMGGLPYLLTLIDTVPSSYHIEYYAQMVQRTALRRKLISIGGQIARIGYDECTELEDTFNTVEQLLFSVTQRNTTASWHPMSTIMDDEFVRQVKLQERPGEATGVPSGYRDIDELTGGFQKSDFILLAARPGAGKSSLALGIAQGAAQAGNMVGILSLEMNRDQFGRRLLAVETGVDAQKIMKGTVRDTELNLVIGAMGKIAALPIALDDTGGLSLSDVRSRTRRLMSENGCDLLIIDYLQLMMGSRTENRVQEVSEISRGLKALARELDIPIIALSQLSRNVEHRSSHVPMLADLRDSGSLEQDADVVMFIYREELYDPDTDKKGIAEIHFAKQRNGPVGVVPLRFDPRTTRFSNLTYRTPDGY